MSLPTASGHSYGSNRRNTARLSGMIGDGRRGRPAADACLHEWCRPLMSASGKTVFWVMLGVFVLAAAIGAFMLRDRNGKPASEQSPTVVALDGSEIKDTSKRYKIERPDKTAEQPPLEALPENAETPPAPAPSDVPNSKAGEFDRAPAEAASSEQPMPPPPVDTVQAPKETGQQEIATGRQPEDQKTERMPIEPVKPPEGPVEKVKEAAAKPETLKPEETPEARAEGRAPQPDKPETGESVILEKVDTPSPPEETGTGERFFVQVDAANVRKKPAMKSKVLFQVRNGCALTVTDKQNGWCAVKMDDGRSGWIYHTLLSDALAPGKEIPPTVREIEAIQVEPPVDGAARVRFKLSAPYAPEIMIIDGKNPRLACDFPETGIASHIGNRIVINNEMIQTIRTGLHKGPQAKVRIVLDLVPGREYELGHASMDGQDAFVLEVRTKGDI